MSRTDIRKIPAGSLNVVVIARHTGLMQAMELLCCQESHGRAQLDVGALLLHPFKSVYRLLELLSRQRPAGRYDGETIDALLLMHFAGFHNRILRKKFINFTVRMMKR